MAGMDFLRELSQSLEAGANAKSVFGDPIQAEGRTVVPVARVSYKFGGGFGSGGPKLRGEGGGGGGMMRAHPAGALEITPNGTRFIPFPDPRWLAVAAGVGAAVGFLICGGLAGRKPQR